LVIKYPQGELAVRRIALHFAIFLITFLVGNSLAGAWNFLLERPLNELPVPYVGSRSVAITDASEANAEKELLELYQQYAIAQTNHDVGFFERVEAENFVLFLRDGRRLSRTEDIQLLQSMDQNIRYRVDDLRVQHYREGAVVAGRMTAEYSGGYRYSWQWVDMLIKRDGRWQILSTTQLN
jgi:hypothetical protein